MLTKLSSGVIEAIEHIKNARSNAADLSANWGTPKRWKIIRDYYDSVSEQIKAGKAVDPYELGLADFLTPIEYAIWCEIRMHGLPFYMQYPVGRRFVDFGDPVMQIAIEVDGAAYHTPEGDAKKDAELEALGWTVTRISGSTALSRDDVLKGLAEAYSFKNGASAAT